LDKIEAVDEEQLKKVVLAIQKLYKDENYHLTKVGYKVVVNKENADKASVVVTIEEGKKARIKRVLFRGNKFMPDRKLRTILFTREDWILGLMDDAGKYSEDSLEIDRKRIEYYYRDFGYLMAKVANVDIAFSKDDREITITFDIREGDQYKIRYLSAPGDELYSEDELLPFVTLKAGEPYSQTRMVQSINNLKTQWGELGYIHADVYPQVVPNEETKEVDITFHAEKGKKMFVNRINITGNKVTKDRVIRRELAIEEGDLITTRKLNASKENVEYLGFFDRAGVNWKIHQLAADQADVEMNVSEAKTGKLNLMMSYGSDKDTSARTLKGSLQLEKSNFMGGGYDIGANIQSSLKNFQSGSIYFFDPHIFDTDISTAVNAYVKHEPYDQWTNVSEKPVEDTIGMSTNVGFLLPWLSRRTRVSLEFGIENISNNNPQAIPAMHAEFQPIVDRTFQAGDHVWFGAELSKDTRNHRVYPSHGYKVLWGMKMAPPGINREFGFIKSEFDWSWYTPLIGDDSLVLALHNRLSVIDSMDSTKIIPYKELFHMGGQTTVRGFVWGSIGPAWNTGDPLGARKAFQFNAELVFPLIPDYSMKGHVFYDAGAGWDTPKRDISDMSLIKRNKFNLRQSVGFGLNLVKPFPAKIDWGYKLDRDKKSGESPHEFHISMNSAW